MEIVEANKLPEFETALTCSVNALRKLAHYELEPGIQQRMLDLGERKEELNETEHEELLDLIKFSEHRTIERLEAEAALNKLGEVIPGLVEAA